MFQKSVDNTSLAYDILSDRKIFRGILRTRAPHPLSSEE